MKKTVKELRLGDVLCYGDKGKPNRVVLDTARLGQQINVLTAELGGRAAVKLDGLSADTIVDVEPRINSEQIDILIMAARDWIEGRQPTEARREMLLLIIDRLVPPEPPTAQELAKALSRFATGDDHVLNLIDRARRTGLL